MGWAGAVAQCVGPAFCSVLSQTSLWSHLANINTEDSDMYSPALNFYSFNLTFFCGCAYVADLYSRGDLEVICCLFVFGLLETSVQYKLALNSHEPPGSASPDCWFS